MAKSLIVITGASSGIGSACALEFSRKGYPLLLLARRKSRMDELSLPNSICDQVDITDADAVLKSIQKAELQYGPADCLINNAGVQLLGEFSKQDPKEWERMIEVNVSALLTCSRAVLPGMVKRNHGTIINVSSVAGHKTFPFHVAYSGTKFAVHGISESLREEVAGSNVRITLVSPGAVDTELLSHTSDAKIRSEYTEWRESIGGALPPEVVASSIAYIYEQPQQVCIRELRISPTRQPA